MDSGFHPCGSRKWISSNGFRVHSLAGFYSGFQFPVFRIPQGERSWISVTGLRNMRRFYAPVNSRFLCSTRGLCLYTCIPVIAGEIRSRRKEVQYYWQWPKPVYIFQLIFCLLYWLETYFFWIARNPATKNVRLNSSQSNQRF